MNLSKKVSERMHVDHSYKPATMLKISSVINFFLGTWSKFTEQLF